MRALSWDNLRHFAAAVSNPLRKYQRGPAGPTHGNLDNERLARFGALAADAAHDLCSPLTTMAVLVEELRQQPDAEDFAENLEIVSGQIEECRRILSALMARSQDRA